MLNYLGKTFKLMFDNCKRDICQIHYLINFQNNLTWPNSTLLKSVSIGLKYSKIIYMCEKNRSIHLSPILKKFSFMWFASIVPVNFTNLVV